MSAEDFSRFSDEALVQRFRTSRRPECFDEIWRRYSKSVYRACLKVLKESASAEEATQEAFFRLFRNIDDVEAERVHPWLRQVARRICLDQIASGQHRIFGQAKVPDLPELCAQNPESDVLRSKRIDEVLAQLPPHQRIVIKLFYMEECGYREIAALTGFTRDQVKSFLQNGKRQFRKLWESPKGTKNRS